jgi:osmotically-inducible protein OsmY
MQTSRTFSEHLPDSDSDESAILERRVRSYLYNRHVAALRGLRVEVDRDTVILTGRVNSFYEKQLSHATARRVAGVRDVLDRIRVVPGHDASPFARERRGDRVQSNSSTRTPQ